MVKTKLSRALASIIAALTLVLAIPLSPDLIPEFTVGALETTPSGSNIRYSYELNEPTPSSSMSTYVLQNVSTSVKSSSAITLSAGKTLFLLPQSNAASSRTGYDYFNVSKTKGYLNTSNYTTYSLPYSSLTKQADLALDYTCRFALGSDKPGQQSGYFVYTNKSSETETVYVNALSDVGYFNILYETKFGSSVKDGVTIADNQTVTGDVGIPRTIPILGIGNAIDVKYLSAKAFANNTGITNVNLSAATLIQSIPAGSFSGCTSLKTVSLSSTVTSIGDGAFSENTIAFIPNNNSGNFTADDLLSKGAGMGITYTTGTSGSSNVTINSIAVKSSVKNITVPSSIKSGSADYRVTNISAGALTGISSDVQINLPSTMTSIGSGVFVKNDSNEVINAVITVLAPEVSPQELVNAGADFGAKYTLDTTNGNKIYFNSIAYNSGTYADQKTFLTTYQFAEKYIVDTLADSPVEYTLASLPDGTFTRQNHKHIYQETDNKNKSCVVCGMTYANGFITDDTFPYEGEFDDFRYEKPEFDELTNTYQISNAGELYWFAEKVKSDTTINGKLVADIVVNDQVINADGTLVSDVTNLRAWVPMEDYNGTFDGNNHTISGLYVNSTSTNAGLFANTLDNAVVINLGVIGSYFKGYKFAAGIVGQGKGKIQNCYNMSTVTATYSRAFAAGICAQYSGSGSVKNCYNMGNVDMDVKNPYNVVYAVEPEYVSNCYYLGTEAGADDEEGFAEFKTEAQFESGEVACLLGSPFGQNIDNGGENQGYPVLGGKTVYLRKKYKTCKKDEIVSTYTNTIVESQEVTEFVAHDPSSEFVDGFCSVCGGYQPATLNASKVYEISKPGQLFWFADRLNNDFANFKNANAKLLNDIVIPEGRQWEPIEGYFGTFDGNGHTIKGMHIDYEAPYNECGMINQLQGTVKHLGIIDSSIKCSSASYVGMIAGNNFCGANSVGTIEDCYINNVSFNLQYSSADRYAYIGGIAGFNYGATIKNCYSSEFEVNTNATTSSKINGIAAGNDMTKCSNNYYEPASIYNFTYDGATETKTTVFASGKIAAALNGTRTGSAAVWGQKLGENGDAYPVFGGDAVYSYKVYENCAANSPFETIYTNDASKNNADQQDEHVFDENGFCKNCSGYRPITQNASGVYEISNAGQLYWFAEKVNGGEAEANAKLMKDITVNENVIVDGQLTSAAAELREWVPINEYAGTFDGNGHTISGLYMSNYYEYNQNNGLFESIQTNGKVYKLGVIDSYFACSVSGSIAKYVGAIAGYNYGGIIEDCYALNVYFNVTNSDYGFTAEYNGIANGSSEKTKNCYAVIYNVADKANNSFSNFSVSDSSYYYLTHLANDNEVDKNVEFADFASGKLTVTLNGTRTGSAAVWGQKLTGDNKDAYPVFSSYKVYSGYKHGETTVTYTNDGTLKLHSDAASEENNNHDSSLDANTLRIVGDDCHAITCSVCGEEFEKAHDFGSGQYKATSDGSIHYIQCQDCGYRRVHSADMDYTISSKYHSGTCNECNYTVSREAHDFTRFFKGDAEKHIAVCEECGFATAKAHNFVNGVCTDCGYEKPLEDTVNITNVTFTVASGKNRVVFDVERDVPVKYTMLEYGIIYSSNGAVTDVESADSLLVKNNVDGTDIKIMKSTNSVNSGKTTIRLIDSGSGVIARPYVLVRNADGQEVYGYGAVAQGNYKELAEKAIKDATRVSIIKVQNDVVVNSKNRVAFSVMRDVKEGYTVIERGIVYSSDGQISSLEQAEEKLYIGNSGVKVMRSASVVPNYGILKVNLTELGNGVYAKGYVVVKDSYGNTATVYSEADYGKNTLESNN